MLGRAIDLLGTLICNHVLQSAMELLMVEKSGAHDHLMATIAMIEAKILVSSWNGVCHEVLDISYSFIPCSSSQCNEQ